MKHLKKFSTDTDRIAYEISNDYIEPYVSLVSEDSDECYYCMFYGCSQLNYIKAMFTTTPSGTYTLRWVDGVASSGTFVKNSAATWNVTGANGVPTGWEVRTASE